MDGVSAGLAVNALHSGGAILHRDRLVVNCKDAPGCGQRLHHLLHGAGQFGDRVERRQRQHADGGATGSVRSGRSRTSQTPIARTARLPSPIMASMKPIWNAWGFLET